MTFVGVGPSAGAGVPATPALRRDSGFQLDVRPKSKTRVLSALHFESHRPRANAALQYALFLLAVVLIQVALGAYVAERGNYSDESAHYLNGLLVRDYLASALGQNPLRYAEAYYLSYPKIAPLMWPPFFHVLLGGVLLPGWPAPIVALLLVASAAAWIAYRLTHIVSRTTNPALAYGAAAMFVTTTMVVNSTTAVMLDVVVAAFALEAVHWLAAFVESGARRHAVAFGLFTACCLLTKGNGLALLLAPVFLVALTRRFDLLKSKWLWFALAIAVGCAFPAVWYSFTVDSGMSGYSVGTADRVIERLAFYSSTFRTEFGTVVLCLAFVGFAARGQSIIHRSSAANGTMASAMAALFLAGILFHLVQPADADAARYLVLVVAPLIALASIGLDVAARTLPIRRRTAVVTALACLVGVNFAVAKPAWTARKPLGFHDTLSSLEAKYGLAGKRILVVSDELGEGALVSDAATRSLTPRLTVLRGSKVIAFDDWNGQKFRMKLHSAEEFMRELEDLRVTFFIVDDSVAMRYTPLVRDLLSAYRDQFELVKTEHEGRVLSIYRLRQVFPGPAKKIRIDVAALGRVIEEP